MFRVRRMRNRVAALAIMFGTLFCDVAVACKDRLYPDTFLTEELADELANYDNVYVVHVQKIVPDKPLAESWYMPPFTFEGKVLKSFKGTQRPGAHIWGKTSRGEEPRARCPIHLAAGKDYLLMMHGPDSPFILPRYGSLHVSSDDEHFRKYVAQIAHFYSTHNH